MFLVDLKALSPLCGVSGGLIRGQVRGYKERNTEMHSTRRASRGRDVWCRRPEVDTSLRDGSASWLVSSRNEEMEDILSI